MQGIEKDIASFYYITTLTPNIIAKKLKRIEALDTWNVIIQTKNFYTCVKNLKKYV